jgi:hypothetical protein
VTSVARYGVLHPAREWTRTPSSTPKVQREGAKFPEQQGISCSATYGLNSTASRRGRTHGALKDPSHEPLGLLPTVISYSAFLGLRG